MKGILVTGTDTGVGKTLVTGYLAGFLRKRGMNVVTQKWVQTGCAGFSEDVALHMKLAGSHGEEDEELRSLMCPYTFQLAASPHLAARRKGVRIDPGRIEAAYHALRERFELVLVEGVGGLLVPLTEDFLLIDLAVRLDLAAILVVPNQLGCINHSLLTIEALRSRDVPLLGIIFNRLGKDGDPTVREDNPDIISSITGVDVLGELPYLNDPADEGEAFEQCGRAILSQLRSLSNDE